MEIIEKLLAICLSFAILAQAMVVRRVVGTWLFPAAIFGLFWFLATIVPLVFLFAVPVNPLAIAYIFVSCTVFSCTALPFRWRSAFAENARCKKDERYASTFLIGNFYFLSIASVVTLAISIGEQGFSFSDIFSNPLAVAGQYMAKRYNDELSVSVFSQLSFVLMYPAAILGGLVFDTAKTTGKRTVFTLLVLLPSIVALLVQGAKGNLFLVLAFFWGAILVCKLNKGDYTLFGKINWFKTSASIAAIVVMVMLSFLSRGLLDESNNDVLARALIRYFASYTSAHLYGFSDWFSYYTGAGSVMEYDLDSETNGFFTFTSLFKLAGSKKEVWPGTYGEYFYYGEYITTNIYTWFRGLIQDFGMGGAIVFIAVFGALVHLVFHRGLVSENKAVSHAFFIHFIGFAYSTYIISLLIWNSAYASFFIVAFLLLVNRWLNRPFVSSSQSVV